MHSGAVTRYQSCYREGHWNAVKIILKYLYRTRDIGLIYGGEELKLEGFTDSCFPKRLQMTANQSQGLSLRCMEGPLAREVPRQVIIADSTMEAEYICGK